MRVIVRIMNGWSPGAIFVETRGQRRVRIFFTAFGLGLLFGAISGVVATPLSVTAYALANGDRLSDAINVGGLLLFVPFLATAGGIVGMILGAVIGVVVVAFEGR